MNNKFDEQNDTVKFQFYDLKINMKVEHMKKNPYALFFCPLSKKSD